MKKKTPMKRFIRKRIIRNNNNKFVTLNLCNETIGFSLLQRRAGCSICTENLYLWRYVWLSFSYFKAIVAFKLARRASTLMPVRSSTLSALSLSLLSLKLCVYGYVCVCGCERRLNVYGSTDAAGCYFLLILNGILLCMLFWLSRKFQNICLHYYFVFIWLRIFIFYFSFARAVSWMVLWFVCRCAEQLKSTSEHNDLTVLFMLMKWHKWNAI